MKLLFVGDYIAYDDFTDYVRNNNYNMSIFGNFINVIEESDFSIYNQEFPLTLFKKKYSTKAGVSCYKAHPDSIELVKKVGFTHATLANNHILDFGITGLKDTINYCMENSIIPFGAGITLNKADEICIIEKDNIRIALINITENEYTVANNYHGGASNLDLIENVKRIKYAKTVSDFVFIISHGGIDFCNYPSPRLVKQFRFFIDMGADSIISHHSHVTSGYEIYEGKPIFYDIGGFLPGRLIVPDCKYNMPVQFEFKNKTDFSFKIFPLEFDFDKMKMKKMEGKRLEIFNSKIRKINQAILDEKQLIKSINDFFLNDEKTSYYLNMMFRSNYLFFKVARKLNFLGVYKKYMLLNNKKNRVNTSSWNMIRCETHKDVLQILYDKYFDDYKNT